MKRPKKCEKHQNWKYIHFCPVCKYESDLITLREENQRFQEALKKIANNHPDPTIPSEVIAELALLKGNK